MENLFVDKWFKLPPKEKLEKPIAIKIRKRKNAKSCKKIKK